MTDRVGRLLPLAGLVCLMLASSGCEGGESAPTAAEGAPTQSGGPPPDGGDPTRPSAPPPTGTEAPGLNAEIFPSPGATSFLTANENELLSAGTGRPGRGVNGRGALDDDADFAAGEADGAQAPGAGPAVPQPPAEVEAVPDPTREIVEADVFKLDGDLLYVLNRLRGLVIIDVSDPDDLRIRGRLPFQAVPVEMYVRDGRAYILSSDYFVYWQYDPEADPQGFHGSQVLIADVSDPDLPERLAVQPIDGEITDSRMVGDVLYTVSKRRPDYWRYNTVDWEDRTWVKSLNIADPNNIREIDDITFRGMSTLIHVAHQAIFVAAWDPNFYLTDPDHEQETLVTYVDISDPAGDLRERGSVYIPGQIADKFKMSWFDGYLRILSQRWREDADVVLNVVGTEHPDELSIDARLSLDGVLQSGLQATRYAEDRAFVFTREWLQNHSRRRLFTLDLSVPLQPRMMGRLDSNIDFTHLEVHGDRLLGVGSHYQRNQGGQVAVALYDVSDLQSPRLLSWQRLGEGNSNSEANWDYKAFKSFPDLGLILVPLNYWTRDRTFQGVQLVDWTDDTLQERGRVSNTGGVRRAFPVGDRLVAVGEMSLATIDARDRDRPRVTDQLHLIRVVHDLFDVQGLQVQLVTDPFENLSRLEVREFGREDDGPTIATLDLPYNYAPQVLRDGDVLHLIGYETDRGQVIRNADLRDPRAPSLKGDLRLTDDFQSIYNRGYSWYTQYWSPYAGLPLRNQILPATFRQIVEGPDGRRGWRSALRFLDLRDLDHPRVADGEIPMNDFPFINKVTHGDVLFSSHVEQATSPDGDSLLYHVRAFVDRVEVTDPDHPRQRPSLNVPGYLVDVSDDGRLLYTVDFQWDDFGRRRNSLNVLRVTDDDAHAELITVLPVHDQIHRAALRPGWLSEGGGGPVGWHDRTLFLTAHKYPWWGVRGDTVSSRQPYTVLRRVDLTPEGAVATEWSATLSGYHFDLLDVDGTRMYLASRGPTGLLVLDVADLAQPVIESAARTIGYLSRIVVNGDHVYSPMGAYGVRRY